MNDIWEILDIKPKMVLTLIKVSVVAIPALLLGYCGGSVVTEIRYDKIVRVVTTERNEAVRGHNEAVTSLSDLEASVAKANEEALKEEAESRRLAEAKENRYKEALLEANKQLIDERKRYENRELYMFDNVGVGLYTCTEETGSSDPDSAYKMSSVRNTGHGNIQCRLPEKIRIDLIKLATEAQMIVSERNQAVRALNSIKEEQEK